MKYLRSPRDPLDKFQKSVSLNTFRVCCIIIRGCLFVWDEPADHPYLDPRAKPNCEGHS